MTKTRLFIIRHGKTMFNTIGRAQGWSDTPLTAEGEHGILALGIGLKKSGLSFVKAYSSDSGRTIQTMGIVLEELGLTGKIPYTFDKRIREWCFGSFDGAYGGELFHGVIPRVLKTDDYKELSLPDLANGLVEVDTAGWAEPWDKLSGRILEGFEAIAKDVEASGGGNALVVSHSMTIGTLAYLIDEEIKKNPGVENGSVTVVEYANGKLSIESLGDVSYRQAGAEVLNSR
ncbi:phosphoglycerate mutase family protein [Streptococcus gordonii]|uniref:histidine phosphatase family protein n=1 Tax=Streptococcus gordonii TaxID=1302 RepID=UPI00077935AF|nr:histidine phosphatase family protein [Streptococcus gordonii]MBZ2130673.1 phosphoglycerate mutase family protein [Streptococcus gordonii]MCY7129756.1 phosphoglycerate mutase family protein [Streptococcus gordonii]MCY7140412.1 phosphoglycerate mutase family protein [Streptococcus gordonii]